MIKLLVTGVNGFVGRALCVESVRRGNAVSGAVRCLEDSTNFSPDRIKTVAVGMIDADTNWRSVLTGCDAVVHLAARVHMRRDAAAELLTEFRKINVQGTLSLARQAAEAGVRRFVYLSSIKVNGERTLSGQPFTEQDLPAPLDPYSISKYEAEEGLHKLTQKTGMETVIIRPPLVYGPGVKSNFLTMMHWLHKGLPMPLGAIHNRRSLVALDNLVDFVITCIDHPAAAYQTFLVSDGEDLSTPELLCRMAHALDRPARLIPVPVSLLKVGAALLGRRDMAQRLCSSLQVDISKARVLLGWNPPISVDEGLRRTAHGFLHETTI